MTRSKKLNDSQVLRLALEVIIDKGPESFTLEDVSKKVKLAPATLIQRFKTKNGLLMEALKQDHLDFSNGIDEQLEQWKTLGIKGLIEFLSGMSQGLGTENLGEHVALLAKDLSEPKLNRMARERMDLVRKTIQSLLEAAVGKGEVRKVNSIEDCVYTIEALWHGSNIQWGFVRRGSIKNWVTDRLESFFNQLRIESGAVSRGIK